MNGKRFAFHIGSETFDVQAKDGEEEYAFSVLSHLQDSAWWLQSSASDPVDPSRRRDKALSSILAQVPPDELLVMVDTTTVSDASRAVDYGRITPITLLDLSIVTFAVVCFDRVVIQPHRFNDFISKNRDIFLILDYSRDFIVDSLWPLVADKANQLGRSDSVEKHEFESAWCKFLNYPEGSVSLDLTVQAQASPLCWSGVVAERHMSRLRAGQLSQCRRSHDVNEFLSIQTMRVLFNHDLAEMLRLPYVSSSWRACVHAPLIARKLEAQPVIDRLLGEVGPGELSKPNEQAYVRECSAPLVLALVLEKMRSAQDYWPVVRGYREQFAPLRAKIRNDREQWQGRSGSYLRHFKNHLNNYLPADAKLAEDAILAAATAGADLIPGAALAKLGLKLGQLIKPAQKLYDWWLKVLRPEVYLIMNLAREAESLRMLEHRIEAIWGHTWTRKHHDELEYLSTLQPGEFLKLRTL